jgi:microcystin-dependent protein
MGQPYVGEIRMFAGNFAPAGWQMCNGQLMPIAENEILFQAIGTTYGGDGQVTFAVPDLRSRVPIHRGTNQHTGTTYSIGQAAGVETVTLSTQQMPAHSHAAFASLNAGDSFSPANAVPGTLPVGQNQVAHGTDAPVGPIDPSSLTFAGGTQPHTNVQAYGTLNYIISLFGIFPTQS